MKSKLTSCVFARKMDVGVWLTRTKATAAHEGTEVMGQREAGKKQGLKSLEIMGNVLELLGLFIGI